VPSVTATNGTVWHLFALPEASSPEPEDSIEFTTIENQMLAGYRTSRLLGSNNGVKSWRLEFPSLVQDGFALVQDPYGNNVSRQRYIRNLYKHNKTTGRPFAYLYRGQYYLVDIVTDSLTMTKRKGVDIYSTSLELRQRRIEGVTIFNPETMLPGYPNEGVYMTATGDVTTTTYQGQTVRVLNAAAGNGYLYNEQGLLGPTGIYHDIFLVLKVREASFSNNGGILSNNNTPILQGQSGTTKFANLAHSNYQYFLNGVEYAQSNQQAPMNAWGMIHLRFSSGASIPDIVLGKVGSTHAKIDIAEWIFVTGVLSQSHVNQVYEHLNVKWNL
jgi:hypothetical protein